MDHEYGADGCLEVVWLWLGRVERLDGECAAGNLEERRAVEVVLELLGLQSSAHDDDLEIGSLRAEGLEQAKQDIGSEGTLVSLVEDDRRVAREGLVVHGLAQQHTVGHVLEEGVRP